MLILISDAFDATLPQRLSRFGEVTDDKNRLSQAEIVLVRSKTKCTKEYIDSAPKLKLIIRGGVGLDNIDQNAAKAKGVLVTNTAEASTVAVAELAFAMMIALPNHLTEADRTMKEQKWMKKELARTELMGKTLTIVGMGRIGTALAIRARAFGMHTIGWHPDVYFCDFAVIQNDLREALKDADYVSMHIPLLPETQGFINKEKLSWFKTGAYLINTGRGKCIVEEDVAEALRSGKLRGYATDVWLSDPPDWGSPLFNAPNTLFTPHFGAETKENMLRIGYIAEQLIDQYVKTRK
ncbi:MAG: NAD(P)-dependent oxidoreductase [Planctomycetota bacterium]